MSEAIESSGENGDPGGGNDGSGLVQPRTARTTR